MFINLSNHPSSLWSSKQLSAARHYGDIMDISFPSIDPQSGPDEIDELVEKYYGYIMSNKTDTVMVQGEFTFTYRLVTLLKRAGVRVVAACSQRRVDEWIDSAGKSHKDVEFQFIQFREY